MTHHDDHLRDAEFGPVIDRLRAERPTASALELDEIRQRVRHRVARSARRSGRTEFMRSRLAILGMLALGMVLSTGGAGLAISGLANPKGDAAQTQYGPSVKPEEDTIGEDDVRGEEDEGGPASRVQPREVQPERQVELGVQDSGDEQLPFTGFAAIPILIGGVALLSTGIVLRRRSGEDS